MNIGYKIDKLDKKILSIVSKNARIPYLEVARACNVSGAAIHQRMQRLHDNGIIISSELKLDRKLIGYTTCAFLGIYLEKAALYKEVMNSLEKIPEIIECHYTTGNYSIFIKIITKDNDHLKEIIADKLQTIDGIARTESFISLEEILTRQIPIQ